jgi:hypothetical protein
MTPMTGGTGFLEKVISTLPVRSRTHSVALVVGAATWVAGFIAVYLVAPLGTGLGLAQSYAVFQSGSNTGNLVAAVVYAFWGAGVLFVIRGSRFSPVSSVLGAHALIGVGIYHPATVMDFGVAHVLGYDEGFPSHGGMAMGLVVSGGIFTVLLVCIVIGRWAIERAARACVAEPPHTLR